ERQIEGNANQAELALDEEQITSNESRPPKPSTTTVSRGRAPSRLRTCIGLEFRPPHEQPSPRSSESTLRLRSLRAVHVKSHNAGAFSMQPRRRRRPSSRVNGCGGQPGTYRSTGICSGTPQQA